MNQLATVPLTRKLFRSILFATACAAVAATFGCADRFELVEEESGRTVRMDRKTGEMAVVDGEHLVPITPPPGAEELNRLGKPTTWGPLKSENGKSVSIETVWRDGVLRYRLSMEPFSDEELANLLRALKGRVALVGDLQVSFFDEDGFRMCSFDVWLSGLAREPDNMASTSGKTDDCSIYEYARAAKIQMRPQ